MKAWKRVVATAVVAAALVSLGAVVGATLAPHPSQQEVTQREIRAPEPALEKFYVPAMIPNQATRIEEQPDAF